MERFVANLKRQAEENPILALGVAAALVTATTKLIGARTEMVNSKAWSREVARRAMKDSLK